MAKTERQVIKIFFDFENNSIKTSDGKELSFKDTPIILENFNEEHQNLNYYYQTKEKDYSISSDWDIEKLIQSPYEWNTKNFCIRILKFCFRDPIVENLLTDKTKTYTTKNQFLQKLLINHL